METSEWGGRLCPSFTICSKCDFDLPTKNSAERSILVFSSCFHRVSITVEKIRDPAHRKLHLISLRLCYLPPQVSLVEQETIRERAWALGAMEQVMLEALTHNTRTVLASRWRCWCRFTPPVVKDSHVLLTGVGQGAYLGGAAGKLGKDIHFHSFFFSLF